MANFRVEIATPEPTRGRTGLTERLLALAPGQALACPLPDGLSLAKHRANISSTTLVATKRHGFPPGTFVVRGHPELNEVWVYRVEVKPKEERGGKWLGTLGSAH